MEINIKNLVFKKIRVSFSDSLEPQISNKERLSRIFGKTLLLTAHPDDEVMFFSPVILSLIENKVELFGLSLSEGNADGIGQLRRKELFESYSTLGVPGEKVFILDDLNLQDGMETEWNPEYISRIVRDLIKEKSIQSIITFDKKGISSHPNHIACFKAISILSSSKSSSNSNSNSISSTLAIYSLQSVSTLTKYLGLTKAVFSHLTFKKSISKDNVDNLENLPKKISFLSNLTQHFNSLKAMKKHNSQLVWFRMIYIFMSCFMYGGILERVDQSNGKI